jgi:SAM-dependent methyltransferase
VERGDLHALGFGDDAFDGAACGEVLEHLEDDGAALRELRRVLVPGGALVASVPADPRRYDWVDRWAGHRRRYTAPGLAERLREAGFDEVAVTAWGFPLTGLYERAVYKPALRRRLAASDGGPPAPPGPVARALAPAVRAALEVDTLFLGRRPGWLGLIATARA